MQKFVQILRPNDPPDRGVALSVVHLVRVLCIEFCVGGDSGSGAEQKEDVSCSTPRIAMECDSEDSL